MTPEQNQVEDRCNGYRGLVQQYQAGDCGGLEVNVCQQARQAKSWRHEGLKEPSIQ
jgi:hypothetical protein